MKRVELIQHMHLSMWQLGSSIGCVYGSNSLSNKFWIVCKVSKRCNVRWKGSSRKYRKGLNLISLVNLLSYEYITINIIELLNTLEIIKDVLWLIVRSSFKPCAMGGLKIHVLILNCTRWICHKNDPDSTISSRLLWTQCDGYTVLFSQW